MPVNILPQQLTSSRYWLLVEAVLLASSDGADIFRIHRSRFSGIVIVRWQEGDPIAKPSCYYGSRDSWREFDDPSCAEAPRQYRTLKKTFQVLENLRQSCKTGKVGLALWTHPEKCYQKNPFHVLLSEGNQFPGSPSQ